MAALQAEIIPAAPASGSGTRESSVGRLVGRVSVNGTIESAASTSAPREFSVMALSEEALRNRSDVSSVTIDVDAALDGDETKGGGSAVAAGAAAAAGSGAAVAAMTLGNLTL
jgi:hypothetical protein